MIYWKLTLIDLVATISIPFQIREDGIDFQGDMPCACIKS